MGPLSWLVATRRTPQDVRDVLAPGDDVIRYQVNVDDDQTTLYCARLDSTVIVVNEDRTYPMLRFGRDETGLGQFIGSTWKAEPTGGTFGIIGPNRGETDDDVRDVIRRELGTRYRRVSVLGTGAPGAIARLVDSGLIRATTVHVPLPLWHHGTGECPLPDAQRQPTGAALVAWAPTREIAYRSAAFDKAMNADEAVLSQLARWAVQRAGVMLPVIASWVLKGAHASVEVTGASGTPPLQPGAAAAYVVTDDRRWVEVWRGQTLSPSQFGALVDAVAAEHQRVALSDAPLVRLGLGVMGGNAEAAQQGSEMRETPDGSAEVARLSARLEIAERALRSARRETAAMARELERLSELADSPVAADVVAEDRVPEPMRPAPAVPEPDDLSTPAAALLAARDVLQHVIVTTHAVEQAHTLAHHGKAALWGRRCWRILVDLDRYAATRAEHVGIANFRAYLSQLDDPAVTASQVAIRESETVMQTPRMRAERTRPVPPEVDPSERALLVEHVRVESGGRGAAPRLYFLDDTSGVTGKVVVGYVGPHLTNAST